MKRLILMRHAKSDWNFGLPDHDRPLNPRGIASARALGDWLRRESLLPDAALVSTARRTRETFGLLGLDNAPRFDATLYEAAPEAMLHALRNARGDTVLMLGHNPGICAFAHALVATPVTHDRFDDYPTGATLIADLPITGWRSAETRTATPILFEVPRTLLDSA